MLSHLLELGLGQVLAPDPKHVVQEEPEDSPGFTGGLWNIVAPDPKFVSYHDCTGNAKSISSQPTSGLDSGAAENIVQCVYCQGMSPSKSSTFQNPSTPHSHGGGRMTTPSRNNSAPFFSPPQSESSNRVDHLVLSAARDLASSMNSPPTVWDDHRKLFSFCASSTELSEKKLKLVKRMLRKDPSLAVARATKMGNLVPDGFTPLHTAAYVGNCDVAHILIDFEVQVADTGAPDKPNPNKPNPNKDPTKDATPKPPPPPPKKTYHPISLDARDIQGRTALHIASEQGHVQMVQLLKKAMAQRNPSGTQPIGPDAPTDLTGRTPMGWAETSMESKARRNRGQLRDELFSPGDVSVYGARTPAKDRIGGGMRGVGGGAGEVMDLRFGFSEMPGLRIEMEDAMCHVYPLVPPVQGEEVTGENRVGFFGVFDGHADGGMASRYIADNIVRCFTDTDEWKGYIGGMDSLARALSKSCQDIDVDLRAIMSKGNRKGGTTGVMAVITSDMVLVGNVGDSRCILVKTAQTEESSDKPIEEGISQLSINDSSSGVPMDGNKRVTAQPLSVDHNPDLPEEKKRIEKAGLTVTSDTFQDGENMTTIYKVQKSENDKIAMSRAFGDFDYKANEEIRPDEQAIVCTPEIHVHRRDSASDMFLVLACDGVWDVMSNDDVAQFVSDKVNELLIEPEAAIMDAPTILPEVGDELLKKCLDLGSSDNMSVLIVAFPAAMIIHQNNDVPRTLNFLEV